MTIWKFICNKVASELEMPEGAKILNVHEQLGQVVFWAEVDVAAPRVIRHFYLVGTGNQIPEGFEYVGTAYVSQYVWHLYEEGTTL